MFRYLGCVFVGALIGLFVAAASGSVLLGTLVGGAVAALIGIFTSN